MGLYLKITIEALSTWVPNAMLVSPNPQFFQIFHPSAVLTCAHCYKIGLYYKISKIRITLFEILSRKWKITSTEHRKDTSTVHSASYTVYCAYMMSWTVDPEKQRGKKCNEEEQRFWGHLCTHIKWLKHDYLQISRYLCVNTVQSNTVILIFDQLFCSLFLTELLKLSSNP